MICNFPVDEDLTALFWEDRIEAVCGINAPEFEHDPNLNPPVS